MRRPSFEYSLAFDLATAALDAVPGSTLAVASSAIHAVELLKRCPGELHLAHTAVFDAARFVALGHEWAWGALKTVSLDQPTRSYSSLIWAEPEALSAVDTIGALRRVATPGATLQVVATGPLRRYLPAWQTMPRPAQAPLIPRTVVKKLVTGGWLVEHTAAFHGPRSSVWSWLARLAAVLGRPDWENRCLFVMRATFQERGWLKYLTPVALIRARAT